jgi:twitching motility protein PilT
VDRVIDVFPADQQNFVRHIFANVIVGIISQILVPRREGGRAAAMEILVGTPAIKNLIRENKSYQIPSLVQTGTEFGMQTLDQSLIKLYRDGIINKDTLFEYCVDEKFVKSVLSGYRD